MVSGFWAVQGLRQASTGDLDCFYQLGSFRICFASLKFSINSSLFLLMTQALLSRILVPGMSNFVNATVCRTLLRKHSSILLYGLRHFFVICDGHSLIVTMQVLHSNGSIIGASYKSDMSFSTERSIRDDEMAIRCIA